MSDASNPAGRNGNERPALTTRQGHPVHDNQNLRTIGDRGPATLENYHFLEKLSHFDRERIPERVVHARGTTAFGYFEAYGKVGDEPISKYTRAKLFQEAGKRTDVAVRFSTVAGGRDSSEAVRDPRGFAVKFYTEDGNWDLVGNNLAVFFIRDAIKFPDFIHSQKPDPVSFEASVPQRAFDFWARSPEAMHMVVTLFSPRGIPATYRHMQGFGVNTYKWVNAQGESVLVKYHWHPKQGVKSWTAADAAAVQAKILGCHAKDLYDAIERGEHPEWELLVQVISDDDHPELDFDPLDDTKVWPEEQFPLLPVGRMVLNRNTSNFFAENEQIAFGTGVLVDGLDFSDDKMLVGRTFSYSDTQRYRVSEPWERDDCVLNLVTGLGQCDRRIQERMLWHLFMCEDELGHRVAEGLGMSVDDVRQLQPLPEQTLNEEELERLRNLGDNGPRDVEGRIMTHCVPNERVAVAEDE